MRRLLCCTMGDFFHLIVGQVSRIPSVSACFSWATDSWSQPVETTSKSEGSSICSDPHENLFSGCTFVFPIHHWIFLKYKRKKYNCKSFFIPPLCYDLRYDFACVYFNHFITEKLCLFFFKITQLVDFFKFPNIWPCRWQYSAKSPLAAKMMYGMHWVKIFKIPDNRFDGCFQIGQQRFFVSRTPELTLATVVVVQTPELTVATRVLVRGFRAQMVVKCWI